MKRIYIACFSLLVASTPLLAKQTLSDDEIRQAIIRESIASYPGPCACPYNLARNGSRCGGRSAYSKLGGYDPLCYPSDISDETVRRYRASHGAESE